MKAISRAEMHAFIAKHPQFPLPRHEGARESFPHFQRAEQIRLSRSEKEAVIFLKKTLLEKSALGVLQDPDYNLGLVRLAQVKDLWVNDLATWKRKTQLSEGQFDSLLKHLVERFKAPLFLRKGWNNGHESAWRWHLHLAQGGSARKLPSMPLELTKKMAHLLPQVPANLSIVRGFRWAQLMGLGGDARLFHAVAGSFLAEMVDDDTFWVEVLAWLVRQPDIDYEQVGPVLDYLRRGVDRQGFSLKGRTWNSVLRGMVEWHEELRILNILRLEDKMDAAGYGLSTTNYEPPTRLGKQVNGKSRMQYLEGHISNMGELKAWPRHLVHIVRLKNRHELFAEGNAMHHCVRTYHMDCLNGTSSIWAMRAWDEKLDREERILTIELNHRNRCVVQVRGHCNRNPTKEELEFIKSWAKREKLQLSSYL